MRTERRGRNDEMITEEGRRWMNGEEWMRVGWRSRIRNEDWWVRRRMMRRIRLGRRQIDLGETDRGA